MLAYTGDEVALVPVVAGCGFNIYNGPRWRSFRLLQVVVLADTGNEVALVVTSVSCLGRPGPSGPTVSSTSRDGRGLVSTERKHGTVQSVCRDTQQAGAQCSILYMLKLT